MLHDAKWKVCLHLKVIVLSTIADDILCVKKNYSSSVSNIYCL